MDRFKVARGGDSRISSSEVPIRKSPGVRARASVGSEDIGTIGLESIQYADIADLC